MRFRVIFRARTGQDGEPSDNPPSFLEPELEANTVVDARFVGHLQPDAQHGSDELEEDDAFLSISAEIWEYDVREGRQKSFEDALRNSGMVMEFEVIDVE